MKLHPILLLLILVFLTSACSTAKPIGVRSNFQKAQVKKIGVMTVFSTGRFSIDAEEFEKIRATYIEALNSQLALLNFDIIERKLMESSLSEPEKNALEDGLGLPKSLDLLFEADRGEYGAEVAVVRKFYESKSLPAHILFAEIIYHSKTVCQESSEHSNAYSQINDRSIKLPAVCILAHFQAKLIDASSGKPMWNNHVFVEHRLPPSNTNINTTGDALNDVIQSVVEKTLAGENGLVQLR